MSHLTAKTPLQVELETFGIYARERTNRNDLYNELLIFAASSDIDHDDLKAIKDSLFDREARDMIRRALWGSDKFDLLFPNFREHKQSNARAFGVPFLYRRDILKPLISDLARSLACRKAGTPCFVELLGGRGEGKSRSVLQLPSCGISMAYINTRCEYSTGYPQRTTWIANYFERGDLNELHVIAIFMAYLESTTLFLERQSDKHFAAVTSNLHKELMRESTQISIINRATEIYQGETIAGVGTKAIRLMFTDQLITFARMQKNLRDKSECLFPPAPNSIFEETRKSEIRFIFVFDHASQLLNRNWLIIAGVLSLIPNECGIIAIYCSPISNLRLFYPKEKIEYLGAVCVACQHIWPEVCGAPGNLYIPLGATALLYGGLISGTTSTSLLNYICCIALQHREVKTIWTEKQGLYADINDLCVRKKCVLNLNKEVLGPCFPHLGCVHRLTGSTGLIRETADISYAIASSYILSGFQACAVFSGFWSATRDLADAKVYEFFGAQILIRAFEHLQLRKQNYRQGSLSLCFYIQPVRIQDVIKLILYTIRSRPGFHEKYLDEQLRELSDLRTRLISIVGWQRQPTRSDLIDSGRKGYGLFILQPTHPYSVIFAALTGGENVTPVFLRVSCNTSYLEKNRTHDILLEINCEAKKLGAKRHVVILFEFCENISDGFELLSICSEQICFKFINPSLSAVLHEGIRKGSDICIVCDRPKS